MNILILGDSLALPRPHRIKTFDPLKERELAVHFDETYGALLHRQLARQFPYEPVLVTNRAQRASTIKHIMEAWADHLFYFTPDIVILHVGVVDCWFREELNGKPFVPKEEFANHLTMFVQLLRLRPEVKVIAIGIAPTSEKMEGRYPGLLEAIKAYNDVIKSMVDYQQFFYVDMEPHIDPHNPHIYLLPDDHHLNKDGHRLVNQLVFPFVCAQMYLKNAQIPLQNGDTEQAHEWLLQAFQLYPNDLSIIKTLARTSETMMDVDTLRQIRDVLKHLRGV